MRCWPALRITSGWPMPVSLIVAFSDDNGAFVLAGVPTGDVSVWCVPSTQYWSNGRVDLTPPAARCDPYDPRRKNNPTR
jgi:hypothetical protein